MKYSRIPKLGFPKGTKRKIRRLAQRVLDDQWIRNGEQIASAVDRAVLDNLIYGKSTTKVSWDGDDVKVEYVPQEPPNGPR